MEKNITCLLVVALLACAASARADDRLAPLKQLNRDGCVQAGSLAPDGPKDHAKIVLNCTCVYDAYYDTFTKLETDQLLSDPGASTDHFKPSLVARLATVKAACRKKIGF